MTSTIGEILPEAARTIRAKTALVVGDRSFSFRELEAMSNRVANGLVSVGVQPGDRVTLYGPNCWEWLVAYYADRQDRRGGESDQFDADHRGGPVRRRGLRARGP